MNSRVHDFEIFVHVAQLKSFTRAARDLSLTVSAVSRAVSRLEEHLGVRLLNRTTRRVALTEEGQTFFERCRNAFEELHEAEASIAQKRDQPRGAIRISLPIALGVQCILPRLDPLIRRYTGIHLDVSLSDRLESLVEEGIDVVLRVGSLPDSALMSRRLGSLSYTLCASPDYLARAGTPQSPDELGDHDCLGFVYPQTRRVLEWSFTRGPERVRFRPDGPLSFDNGLALVDAAIGGAGVIQTQTPLLSPAIKRGELVPLLTAWKGPERPLQLLYKRERHPSQRLRLVVDHLAKIVPEALKA